MRKIFCDVCTKDTEEQGATMRVKRGVATNDCTPFEKYVTKFEGRVIDMPTANMTEIDVCPDCHKELQDALRLCVMKIRGKDGK